MASTARQVRRLGPLGVVPARALELTEALVGAMEREALRRLLVRLDLAGRPLQLAAGRPLEQPPGTAPRPMMGTLLARSLDQDTATGRSDWHASVLARLVPDEARIIAALASGLEPPVLHVLARRGQRRVLENASLVGRLAALTLPDMTPTYVSHLRFLGLVETGPEDISDPRGYELLLADRGVRAALREGALGKLPARVIRRTLRLTDLGRELWAHSQPDGGAAWS